MDHINLAEAQRMNHELDAFRAAVVPQPISPRFFDRVSLVCTLALLTLSLNTLVAEAPHSTHRVAMLIFYVAQCPAFLYATLLTVNSTRGKTVWPRTAHIQRAVILLVIWAVYAYRNIWPLATYNLAPLDVDEGVLLWVKVVLLTLVAIALPLVSTRRAPLGVPQWDARPEQTASILSIITFSWLNPLIDHAQKVKHVSLDELPPLAEYNSIEELAEVYYKYVDPMQAPTDKKKDWRVGKRLMQAFLPEWLVMASMVVIASISSFLVPLGLKHILAYIEHGAKGETIRPWFWIAALLLGSMTVSLAMQFYHYVSTQVVARTQALVTQLLYDHALHMRAQATIQTQGKGQKESNGNACEAQKKGPSSNMPAINNLVTADLKNYTDGSTFWLLIYVETPIQVALSIYFLYEILGWSTFIGVAELLVSLYLAEKLNDRNKTIVRKKAGKADERCKLVTQMLNNIRTIKLLGWEPEQDRSVDEARTEELHEARKEMTVLIGVELIKTFVPLVVMLSTYACYTLVMHQELSATIVFSTISLFEILRSQVGLFLWRRPILNNGLVAISRINQFFRQAEVLDEFDSNKHTIRPLGPRSEDIAICDADFFWTKSAADGLSRGDHVFSLKIDGVLRFETGSINLIHGPTACGKTSLLMALLGEMHYTPKSSDSHVSFPRDNTTGVAYVAQEAWILQGTVRDNIVFGSPFDERRYKTVLRECALTTDMKQWKDGDETVVGQRGTALSGGQKARIALARAIYSSAKIVLIDDILAALDNTTGQHIVRRCFCGELLRGRTVLLVSNNVSAVKPIATRVIEMGPGGTIVDDKLQPEAEIARHASELKGAEEEEVAAVEEELKPTPPRKLFSKVDDAVKAEEIRVGHVGWGPLTLLFGNMSRNPVLFWLALIAALSFSGLAVNMQFWLLGDWAKQYAKKPAEEVSVPLFLGIYSALLVAATLADLAARTMHMVGSLQACTIIHKQLIEAVLGTTLRWLEETPTSRVITRCSEDIRNIDNQVVKGLFTLLQWTAFLVLRLIMIMIIAPIFSIPIAVVALVGGLYTKWYMKAQLPAKREESNTRAPLVGHLNSTIAGLVSIRAYAVQQRFRRDMFDYIDRWTRASNAFYNLNRWVIVRADMTGTLFTVSLAIYLTYFAQLDASNIGFSLSMAIGFSSKIYEWVRTFNAFELAGNSLERIEQYLDIEREEELMGAETVEDLDDSWPRSGDLQVKNLRASYGEYENTPEVLKGISFTVKSGERIGVVGRTGSGKSTLTLALLRCIFTNVPPRVPTKFRSEGEVVYSGRPIGSVGLSTLRKSITIIPQNPELFAGTIQHNLDPFGYHDTPELQAALLSAQGLESTSVDGDRMELGKRIAGNGDLSAGERQIVALARAIVRKSRLLIMDEATSSIDHECDARIQRSLRNYLKTGVTLLTVAHRLPTIQDYDRVMVLQDGEMVEFDSPAKLLRNETSYFKALVDAAPKEERDSLYGAAGISA